MLNQNTNARRPLIEIFSCSLLVLLAPSFAPAVHADRIHIDTTVGTNLAAAALTPLLTARAFRGAVSITSVNDREDAPETTTESVQFVAGLDGQVDRYRTDTLSWSAGNKMSTSASQHTTEVFDGKFVYSYVHGSNHYSKTAFHSRPIGDMLQLPPTDVKWNLQGQKRRSSDPDDCLCTSVAGEKWKLFLNPTTHALHRIVHQVGVGNERRTTTIQIVTIGLNAQALLLDSAFQFQPPFGALESRE